MKKTIFLLSLFALGTTTMQSCKKTEDSTTANNTTTAVGFTCKINGSAFTADSSRINHYQSGFAVIAFKGGTTAFEINLKNPAVGSHALSGGNESATYIDGSAFFTSNSGAFMITALDSAKGTATGTFTFTAIGSDSTGKTFTEGIINIK